MDLRFAAAVDLKKRPNQLKLTILLNPCAPISELPLKLLFLYALKGCDYITLALLRQQQQLSNQNNDLGLLEFCQTFHVWHFLLKARCVLCCLYPFLWVKVLYACVWPSVTHSLTVFLLNLDNFRVTSIEQLCYFTRSVYDNIVCFPFSGYGFRNIRWGQKYHLLRTKRSFSYTM